MSVDGGLYGYSVSNAACYVAIVVYAILSIHHTWILFRHRCWYWIPFLVGGYMEVAGYIVRRISGDDDTSMPLFAVQFLFVLLPPILFAASIYMTLGRLLRYVGATQLSPIPIKWVTPTFVTGDIISLALVGAGGGIQATSPDDQDALDTGKPIMMTGLGIQVLFFSIFIIEVATCHVRLNGRNWQAHSPGKFSWP
ncbi:hypothetical protein TRICI_006787 [Trichomonascus ciferrii]|uniref:RTA1 like protein n=1 Tax=Trichomonascus ciferrii TaxID=44093 RepID=A0A642UDE2_9ASCO|nr:hypothetical protein TRICI_006787 [Trichomonascus ciferrii]